MDVSIIFERGVEFSNRPNAIPIEPSETTIGEVIARARSRYNVRPVLLKEKVMTGTPSVPHTDRWRLFSLDGEPNVGLAWSALMFGRGFAPAMMRHQHALAYVVGTVVYHCERLADVYSTIALNMVRISSIPGYGDAPHVSFGYQLEPYFELDALLTGARRAYDASRYLLWSAFGSTKGGVPSNFKKTLAVCSKLPPELRGILEESWCNYGERLTDYRDCIIHYTPIDFGMGSASMNKLDSGVWSVMMRIPDNPEAKSKSAFTYAKNLDALTYGWELSNEIVRIATTIMTAVQDARPQTGSLPSVPE